MSGRRRRPCSRKGTRPKSIQTAEGEISVDMPQVRGAAAQLISRVFPNCRTIIWTRPIEALMLWNQKSTGFSTFVIHRSDDGRLCGSRSDALRVPSVRIQGYGERECQLQESAKIALPVPTARPHQLAELHDFS